MGRVSGSLGRVLGRFPRIRVDPRVDGFGPNILKYWAGRTGPVLFQTHHRPGPHSLQLELSFGKLAGFRAQRRGQPSVKTASGRTVVATAELGWGFGERHGVRQWWGSATGRRRKVRRLGSGLASGERDGSRRRWAAGRVGRRLPVLVAEAVVRGFRDGVEGLRDSPVGVSDGGGWRGAGASGHGRRHDRRKAAVLGMNKSWSILGDSWFGFKKRLNGSAEEGRHEGRQQSMSS